MKRTNLKPLEETIIKALKTGFYYNAREGLKKLIIIDETERGLK